jgi:CubicO group peptidase (beta-lactamase class C family)
MTQRGALVRSITSRTREEEIMASGGFAPARLERLRAVMAGYVERGEVPGIVALFSRRGETQVETFGTMAASGGAPITRDALFRISSMAKPVTAAATMLLVEECKLRLDEPVDRLLPELARRRVLRQPASELDDTVPATRPITVRDLLTFTMGMGLIMAPPETYPIQRALAAAELGQGPPMPATPPAPDEWMRRLGALPLVAQPGEHWMYNTGADVLSVLIARAAGQSLADFLRERLFAPLGMRDTGFNATAANRDRLVTAYWTEPDGGLKEYDPPGGQWSGVPAFPSGAGGLVATADDFLAFGQMLLNKGRHGREWLLSRRAVELMTTDHLTPAQKLDSALVPGYWETHGWGFGMAVDTARGDLANNPGRFGWDGGMGTSWWSDPGEDLTGILLTQCAWRSPSPPNVCRDFWTLVYQALDD